MNNSQQSETVEPVFYSVLSRFNKTFKISLSVLFLVTLSFQSFGQLSITPWRMNYGGGVISFNIGGGSLGNPAAYSVMNIPAENNSGWGLAPLVNGAISFGNGNSSILPSNGCRTTLDFTYFETFLDIPTGATINDLRVSFASVDDGARAYIFNSAHPNGAFNGEIQIGSTNASLDYSQFAVAGERNRIVIVQFDSCPTGNTLRGANVEVNGTVVVVDNPPTAIAQDVTVQLDVTGNASITTQDIDNGSSDDSGSVTLSLNQINFDCTDVGVNTVTLTVTDPAGNTATATATVTVLDVLLIDAQDDLFTLDNCEPITFSAADLLGNDTDPYGETLIVEFVDQPNTGSIVDNGNGTFTYTPGQDNSHTATASYLVKRDDGTVVFAENGHFYEFVPASGISWTAAKTEAEARTHQGRQGYLVTITSQEENDFAFSKINAQGWIGATDFAQEGTWLWAGGPEAGQQFYSGSGNGGNGGNGAPVNGAYNAWGGVEPNNAGDEDYAHFLSNGLWNDFPNSVGSIQGYIVEYGGLASDCNIESTATAQISFTLNDTEAPVITAPADISVIATSAAGTTVSYTAPVGTDNCSVTTALTAGFADGATFPIATTVVTYTATDASGNTALASFNVSVTGIAPEIVGPANITVNNDAGLCGATVNFTATETVGIPASVITYSIAPGSFFGVGTTTVTATATNAVGTSIATFDVTVNDNQAPTITSPFDITTNVDSGICGAVVNYDIPTASDNCGTGTPPTTLANHTFMGDLNGHTYFLSNTRTTPEVAHANAIAAGGHLVTITNAAENLFVSQFNSERIWIGHTDRDVEGDWKWITNEPVDYTNWAPGEPNDAGAGEDWAVINWSGSDPDWNDWFFNSSTFYAIEFDGGTLPTTLVSGPAPGDVFPVGTTTVTYQAVDPSGNAVQTSFDVTVIDNISPTISVPTNIDVFATSAAGAAVNYTTPVGTDNCSVTTVLSAGFAEGATFPIGTTVVTYTATDASGNTALASFNVSVTGIAPEIVGPANITVNNDAGVCGATVNFTATETVGIPASVITYDIASGSSFVVGTTTVTATATNAVGTSTETFSVTVEDTEAPNAITQDRTIQLDANGNVSITAAEIDNGSNDNCAVESVEFLTGTSNGELISNGGFDNSLNDWTGVGAIEYRATGGNPGGYAVLNDTGQSPDPSLNQVVNGFIIGEIYTINGDFKNEYDCCGAFIGQVAFGVDVDGNQIAALTNPGTTWSPFSVTFTATSTSHTIGFRGEINGTDTDMAIDNISIATPAENVTASTIDYDCSNVGQPIEVTLLVTDVNGNQSIETAIVTVEDNILPVITAPANVSVNATSAAGAAVNYATPVGTDNCSVTTALTAGFADGATFPIGTTVVTYTATDASGNTASASFNVSVTGIAPVITVADITVNNDAGVCGATVNFAATETTVGIPAAVITYSIAPGSSFAVGTISVTATATNAVGTSTSTFDVTVIDNIAPSITLNGAASVDHDAFTAYTDLGATTADNCSATLVTTDDVNVNVVGNYTVTYTSTDGSGNVTVVTRTVNVQDVIAPTAIAQDITVQLDATGNVSITPLQIDNGSGDDSGNVTLSIDQTTFDCSDVNVTQYSLRFDGTLQYVTNEELLNFSNDFTIEMWVNPTEIHEIDPQVNSGFGGISGQRYVVYPRLRNNNSAGAGISVGTNGISVYEHAVNYIPATLVYQGSINGWTHVAVVYTNRVPSLYINGTLVKTGVVSGRANVYPSASGNGTDGIGGGNYGFFNGEIDEFRIWNRSLSATEISNQFSQELSGNENGLYIYYPFNDGGGSTVALNKANSAGLDGDLVNMDVNSDWVTSNPFGQQGNQVTLTVTDPAGNTATATANVTVLDVLPIDAQDDSFTLNNCEPITFSTADLLGNDTDPYGETLIVEFVDQPNTGSIVDNGNGTFTYTPGQDNSHTATASYLVKRDDGTVVFAENGHFYEFVSAPNISWEDANAAAEAREHQGRQGYLVTITSAAENQFAFEKIGQQGWIGATDMGTEDVWIWSGGPEAGQQFWQGRAAGSVINGGYNNWQSGEPNQSGNEDYAHFRADGTWNDFPNVLGGNQILGYVVEYGGMASDCNIESTATAQISFILNDTEAPVITAPTDISVIATSAAGAAVNYTTPVGTDNCSVTTALTAGFADGATFPIGTTVVTHTATDASGNTASASFNVSVTGIAPEIVGPADITVNNDAGVCAAVVNFAATETVGIPASVITYDIASGSSFVVGTTTVTATASNAVGTSTATFTITVADNEAPTVITQNIIVDLDANGNASITTADINDNSTDACGIVSMSLDNSIFDCSNVGVNTVTLTVIDNNGNVSARTATVTVNDVIAPVVITSDVTIQLALSGTASINVSDIENGSSDICGIATYSLSQTNFDCSDLGTNTVILSVTDSNGNVSTAEATVTIEDVIAPVISGPSDIFVETDPDVCFATVDFNKGIANYDPTGNQTANTPFGAAFFDSAFAVSNLQTFGYPESFNTGVLPVGPITTAAGINTSQYISFEVVFPAGTLPNKITYDKYSYFGNGATKGSVRSSIDGFASDISSIDINPVQGELLEFNIGGMGSLSGAVEFRIYFYAATGYDFMDLVSSTYGGTGLTVFIKDVVQTSDNCNIVTIEYDGLAEDNVYPLGTTSITVTSYDASGNSATTSFNITVSDATLPVIHNLPTNITVDAPDTACEEVVLWALPTVTDNCSVTITSTSDSGDTFPVGTTTVTYTATDGSGNTVSGSFDVTVEDNIAPVVNTNDVTISLDFSGSASINVSMIDNVSTDACGIATYSLDKTSFDCTEVGINTVTLTVTDVNGNVSTASATVTVEDNVAPIALTQNVTVQLDASGNGSTTAAAVNSGSGDACGIASMSLDITSFDCSNVGLNDVILTVTDNNGNVSTASATVTVEDNIAPTVITQDISVSLDENGDATITADDIIVANATETCSVSAYNSNSHAVWLSNYTPSGSNARFLFDQNGGQLTQNDNGIATIVGNIANRNDPDDSWTVQLNLTDKMDWNQWSALGRSWKGNANNVGNNYQDWSYYIMDTDPSNPSILTGTGSNAGKTKTLAHMPADYNYGFQIGEGANDKNTNYGMSGWFGYQNDQGQTVQGDFNLNVTNCQVIIGNGSSDACGIATYSLDKTSFDCTETGANTVTLTVTDVNGNVSEGTATVTVIDVIAPIMATQNITVELDASGEASITTTMIDNGTTDNCTFTLALDNTSFTCDNMGDNTVTLTATDASGNSSEMDAIVTVIDVILPTVMPVVGFEAFLDENGETSITVADVEGGSFDNCDIASVTIPESNYTCEDLGPNNVTITVTDVNGNVNTGVAVIEVRDIIAPTVGVQGISVELDENGQASIVPTDVLLFSEADVLRDTECTITSATDKYVMKVKSAGNYNDDDDDDNGWMTADPDWNIEANKTKKSKGKKKGKKKGDDDDDDGKKKKGDDDDDDGKKKKGDDDDDDGKKHDDDDDDKGDKYTQYVFDGTGTILKRLDGSVRISGNLVNSNDANDGYAITLELVGGYDYQTWTAMGGKVKKIKHQNYHLDWTYYNLSTGSLEGTGSNAGEQIAITAYHSNEGFQLGDWANTENGTEGLRGKFKSNLSKGELRLDVADCTLLPVPDGTVYTSDNCTIVDFSFDQDVFTCNDLTETVVNLTATDQSGNQTTVAVMVSVSDNIAPVAVAQNIIVSLGAYGTVVVDASLLDGGSSDNTDCGLTYTLDRDTFDCDDIEKYGDDDDDDGDHKKRKGKGHNYDDDDDDNNRGKGKGKGHKDDDDDDNDHKQPKGHKVTLTVTDAAGNTDTAEAYITIVDDLAPVIEEGPLTLVVYNETKTYRKYKKGKKGKRGKYRKVSYTKEHKAYVKKRDIEPLVTDNCEVYKISFARTKYGVADAGVNQLLVTAKDKHGNESMGVVLINVIDITSLPNNVSMCYKDKAITVKKKHVQRWLRKGASLGSCGALLPAVEPSLPGIDLEVDAPELVEEVLISLGASPNPATDKAMITFSSEESGRAVVKVYNMQGIEVGDLYDGDLEANKNVTVVFRVDNLPSGVLLVRLQTQGQVKTLKLLVRR